MTRKEFQAQLRERIGLFNLNYTAFLDADLVTLRYDMEDPNPVSPTVPAADVDQVLDWAEAHARATYRAQVAARPQIKLEGYEGPDPKREIPIGYRVFSEGGPFQVRYPDGSHSPIDYSDIADAIADAQFHAWAWPQPTPEDTAMSPADIRRQLPAGYTLSFSNGKAYIGTPTGQTSLGFKPWEEALAWAKSHAKVKKGELAPGYQTWPIAPGSHKLVLPGGEVINGFHNAEAAMLASWDHLAQLSKHVRAALDENRLHSLQIPEWAAQGTLLEQCQAHAPFGFTLERQGDFHFRILGPDGVYIAHNLANPEEALAQAKQMDARRVEHAIYCPPGYMVRNLSDDPSDPTGTWVAFRQGQSQRIFNATYDQRDWAMGAARDHALQQEKGRRHIDTSHYEQTGTITVHGRRTLGDGREVPEGWGILQSKRALDAGTEDGWNVTQPNHAGPVKVIDRDEPREWPTPEAALDYILTQVDPTPTPEQFREIRSRIIAPAKVSQTEINQIAMVLPEGVTATGQLQWGPSANDPITLWRLQRQSDGAMTPWHNTETLTQINDLSLLFVMDEPSPDVAQPATVQDIPESAHKAVAEQVLPEGYSIRMRPPFGSHPVQFRVLYPEGGRSSLFKHATAAARHARDHWAALTTRDETRMPPGYGWTYDDLDGMPSMCKVVTYPDGENSEAFDERTALATLHRHAWDHFENQLPPTPEDTAMTHPAHEGHALREIEKMIRLLENGEWADTFPRYAQGQRLNAVINNMIGLQRKSDEAGQRMAEQLEQERSRQETNPGFIKQMTELITLLEARDFDGIAAMETTFSGSQALQAAALAVLQERDDANDTLTRMTAEEPHNWAKATYELDALLASARQGEAEVKDCDATTPVSKPWKDLLIELMHAAGASTAARDSSSAAFAELSQLRDLFDNRDLEALETYETRFAIGAIWKEAGVDALRVMQLPNPELPPTFKSAAVELAMAVLDTTNDRVPHAYRVIRLAAGTPAPEAKA